MRADEKNYCQNYRIYIENCVENMLTNVGL